MEEVQFCLCVAWRIPTMLSLQATQDHQDLQDLREPGGKEVCVMDPNMYTLNQATVHMPFKYIEL